MSNDVIDILNEQIDGLSGNNEVIMDLTIQKT